MRLMISGILAAIVVIAASVVPASACGGCWGCGYVSPCATTYVQPYAGCCAYERLPDPEVQYHSAPMAMPQYYYVNQGPTYTGPGAFAPHPYYQEGGVTGWHPYHHRHYYGYGHGYWHHRHAWHHYGYRPHVLHSYY